MIVTNENGKIIISPCEGERLSVSFKNRGQVHIVSVLSIGDKPIRRVSRRHGQKQKAVNAK